MKTFLVGIPFLTLSPWLQHTCMTCDTGLTPFTFSFDTICDSSINLPLSLRLYSRLNVTHTYRSPTNYRIHASLLTTHFASYAHTDRDTLETLPPFSQPALPVGSLEVLCPSSPCPWELCLRAGAGGVPRCTMCASHSGSRCTPPPLHGSGELPNSEGLSVRVGERACYHRTASNISLPSPMAVDRI